MIVIKVNDFRENLTVDSTEVSVDTILYSVDATIVINEDGLLVKFIPRYFVDICNLILRNELTDEVISLELPMIDDNGIAILNFNSDISNSTSFEMIVNDLDNNLLFRGKAFSTNSEDIQNYTMNTKINNKIII